MIQHDLEVTHQLETGEPDGEDVPLRRCVCGQTYHAWDLILHPDRDHPRDMPCCGAKLYARVEVRVYGRRDARQSEEA